MNYFLIKLAFDTPVHFGPADTAQSLSTSEDHLLADTVFSALCHTAMQAYGLEMLERLCGWAKDGSFLLSDTMPWKGEDFFLPKPYIFTEAHQEVSASAAKALKKMAWIPVIHLPAFGEAMKGGEPYNPASSMVEFGISSEVTRASIKEADDALPYAVGLFRFAENSGLYLIAGLQSEEQENLIRSLFTLLGMSGIGGKISSGFGKFHIDDMILLNEPFDKQTSMLYEALAQEKSRQLLLTTSLPHDNELEALLPGSFYQVIRRGGFVASEEYANVPMKKQTQYFLRAGSVFNRRFQGDLYDVSNHGKHPVYRYGKPLLMGVNF